jgi:hypothetical protein
VGKTKRGKGSKIMAIADRKGLPVAVHVESATPHEVTIVSWAMNEAENFLGMLQLAAASFCCGVYEMPSSEPQPQATQKFWMSLLRCDDDGGAGSTGAAPVSVRNARVEI